MMRLFIAIELPKSVIGKLQEYSRMLQKVDAQARYVPKENYHLTLRFIGETDEVALAVEAMQEAVRGIKPFSLHLTGFDTFPNGVAFVSAAGSSELFLLEQSLSSALKDRGFGGSKNRFKPHITLARNVKAQGSLLQPLKSAPAEGSFYVDHITLFESVRREHGMQYIKVHQEPLQ